MSNKQQQEEILAFEKERNKILKERLSLKKKMEEEYISFNNNNKDLKKFCEFPN